MGKKDGRGDWGENSGTKYRAYPDVSFASIRTSVFTVALEVVVRFTCSALIDSNVISSFHQDLELFRIIQS